MSKKKLNIIDRLFGREEAGVKRILYLMLFVLLLFFIFPLHSDKPANTKAREIVRKMDELFRARSSVGTMEMEIITPHWQRTLRCQVWSQGMDETFIRLLDPKKERGMATLRVKNEMWNFLPKTNKVIKIPPSLMMGSWMGSDFTNDDLVKEITFIDDYTFEIINVENPDANTIYLKCVPKKGVPVVWGHIILAVRDSDYLPVWQKYFDEKGKLMREMFFKDVKKFGKRTIPSVMELIPTNKKNQKTIVRYLDFQFNIKLDKSIFSLRNLRSRI